MRGLWELADLLPDVLLTGWDAVPLVMTQAEALREIVHLVSRVTNKSALDLRVIEIAKEALKTAGSRAFQGSKKPLKEDG